MALPDGDNDDHHLSRLSHPLPDRSHLPGRYGPDCAVLELQRALVCRVIHSTWAASTADRARGPAAPPSRSRARARPHGRLVAWLVLTLVVLLVAAALAARNVIAEPGCRRACRSIRDWGSLELPLLMEFRDLRSSGRDEPGRQVLVVTARSPMSRPAAEMSRRSELPCSSADRQELDFVLFDPPQPALGRGAACRFEVELGAAAGSQRPRVSFGEPR